jgi:DNA adenine methylase
MREVLGTTLTPFLKWAGGKRWLVDDHFDIFDINHSRFIEPFLGSGAVFFRLTPQSAILSDTNNRLVETYQAVRDHWQEVERHLRIHQRSHNEEYYYKVRRSKPRSPASKAAQLIYLNRTCWNGLYRVNLKGEFNVPKGTKSKVVFDTDNFRQISAALANAELRTNDFEDVISEAGYGDLVFVDPPYTVNHNDNAFIKYNERLFSWADQVRLRNCVLTARRRGARLIVTNAYHECIRELYKGVGEHIKLSRTSVISGKASSRGRYEELVIRCV